MDDKKIELMDEVKILRFGGSLGLLLPKSHVDFHSLSEGDIIKLQSEINSKGQRFDSFWKMTNLKTTKKSKKVEDNK